MRTNNTIADTQLNDIIDSYTGETRDWWKLVNEDAPKRSSSFLSIAHKGGDAGLTPCIHTALKFSCSGRQRQIHFIS